MEKIDFRKLLSNKIEGNSEDVEFIIGFTEKAQAEGKLSDEELLREAIAHLAQMSNFQRVRDIVALNTKAAEAIEGLKNMGHWGNLHRIAKHSMKTAIEAIEADPHPAFHTMLRGDNIRLAVLEMGSDEFDSIFTKEFLEKFK